MKLLLVIACVALAGCDDGHRAARTLRDATLPAGESTPSFDVAERQGQTFRYAWQFATTSDWQAYTEWATGKLIRQGYQRAPGEALALTRYDGADLARIEFTRGEPEKPTRVLVKLTIMPD